MSVFLDKAIYEARRRVESARSRVPAAALEKACEGREPPPSFLAAVRRGEGEAVKVIAEVKRCSPSRGPISPALPLEELVASYERGGACAVSVLTEPVFFAGSLEDLARAAGLTGLPLLRKDFIVDPYQLLEARAAGASAVLLIALLLEGDGLRRMLREADTLGLHHLVEVRDEREVDAALEAGATALGVNNRDLHTLKVDLEVTRRIAPLVPERTVLVSESGYSRREQLEGLEAMGVDAVLAGEALAGSDDPETALRKLRGDQHGHVESLRHP